MDREDAARKRSEIIKSILGRFILCLLLSAGTTAAADCEGWNTRDFFKSATLKVVTDCLQAGADPNAQTKDGFTPLQLAAAYSNTPAVVRAAWEDHV